MKFWIKMISGLLIGIIIGSYISPGSPFLEPLRVIGMLFFRLLNFLVFPLLLLSGIRSILYLKSKRRLFLTFIKSIGYFLLITATGATIGMIFGHILKPGAGVNIVELETPIVTNYPDTSQFLLSIIPESLFEFLKSNYYVLPVLFLSYILVIGISLAKNEASPFLSLIESFDNTLHRLNMMILEFLPIGIFAYIGYIMGFLTVDKILPYLKLILVIVAASFVQVFLIQALLVFFITRLNPFVFVHAVLPATILGYVADSRYTAYAVLAENMERNLGTERETFTFVSGIGVALALSGSALSAGVSTLFVAQAYGLDLSAYLQILIVFLITVATIKMDGLKVGGIVLLTIVLQQIIKLPQEGYALLLGAGVILSQIEQVVNVTGNATVSYIISYREGAVSSVSMKDFI